MSGQVRTAGPVAGNDRMIAVLDALITRSRGEGWGVRELAEAVGASRSTVNRVLQGLVERGLARVDASASYHVGPRLLVLAKAMHDRHPLLRGATPVLEELSLAADGAVFLAVHGPRADAAFVALLHEHLGPIRYRLEPGMEVPLDAGAAGRAIASRVDPDALEACSPRGAGRTSIEAPMSGVDARRSRDPDFFVTLGEHLPLAAEVAAPLRTSADIVAAVCVMRPRYSMTDEDLDRIGSIVRKAADAVAVAAQNPAVTEQPAHRSSADGTALGRIQRLLEILVAEPSGAPTGVELARRLGANEATAARLRSTAQATGLAVPVADRRMAAGPLLLRWAAWLGASYDIADLVRDVLKELVQNSRQTVGLTVFDPRTTTATIVTEVRGSEPMNYTLGVGSEIPLYAGAAGKAILAHCPAEVVRSLSLRPITSRSPDTMERLQEDLALIRATGWASAEGERIPDAFGLAVPFFVGRAVAGSLNCSIPRWRAHALDQPALARMLSDAAGKITALLTV